MLMYSSLIFITNVGHSIYKKSYMYTSTFSFLLVSSVMWHGTRLTVWFWIDQIAIYNLVIVSLLMRKYLSDVYNDFCITLVSDRLASFNSLFKSCLSIIYAMLCMNR